MLGRCLPSLLSHRSLNPPHPSTHVQRCPVMSAGPQYEYLWADGVKVRTPVSSAGFEAAALVGRWNLNRVAARSMTARAVFAGRVVEASSGQAAGLLCPMSHCAAPVIGMPSPVFVFGAQVKTPVKLSAPDYINCLFDWVEDQVGSTGLFTAERLNGCMLV